MKLILSLVLASCFCLSLEAHAFWNLSFPERQLRYPAPTDFFAMFWRTFPAAKNAAYMIPDTCRLLDAENRSLLGDSNPSAGEPVTKKPTPAFLRWYSKCLSAYLDLDMKSLGESGVNSSNQDVVERYYGLARAAGNPLGFGNQSWSSLAPAVKLEIALQLMHQWIGPKEIIEDFGFVSSETALAQILIEAVDSNGNLTVARAVKNIVFMICMRDEFLMF